MTLRQCTCHPDDNPPRPCPQKFALQDCRDAARWQTAYRAGAEAMRERAAAEAYKIIMRHSGPTEFEAADTAAAIRALPVDGDNQ